MKKAVADAPPALLELNAKAKEMAPENMTARAMPCSREEARRAQGGSRTIGLRQGDERGRGRCCRGGKGRRGGGGDDACLARTTRP